MPRVYIIAGPNGAGKTTFAERFLPHYEGCAEFVNADLIARGLSPFAPERAASQAGRIALGRIRALAHQGCDFAFETTLSGRTYAPILRDMSSRGYTVRLAYLWVPSVEMCVQRVAVRVLRGGHDIPEAVIRRRFDRSLRNLFRVYLPVVDSWAIYDNSTEMPRLVACFEDGALDVTDAALFRSIQSQADKP